MLKNHKQGFGLVIVFIILGIGGFLYFYKDENGDRYLNKLISFYPDKIDQAKQKADDLKKTMQNRDKEIEAELNK